MKIPVIFKFIGANSGLVFFLERSEELPIPAVTYLHLRTIFFLLTRKGKFVLKF